MTALLAVIGLAGGLYLLAILVRRNPDSCDDCGREDLPLYVLDGGLICEACRELEEGPHAA